ncbi:Permease of the drug/metabolite transporter (DMT) superfamily [Thioalkalivibrio nitratireducens DSM 14787]|uniref:Permease of the drug/metabolite transporter (DMT) superfamily n=1 Tax=Thioalkalivibrio nitratireducens (strain DSM 14787 / UNIQEM 213 / ALEN2) TaxID=1255043 RepID=L0DSV3_THIND|nr:DMT family transporter [Thioalkalivibrio nitratireducens]AGA32694.1 Permease of the drug/metabolite transporter (DMT) superfamily [Thioalkalivibrio nitratireducens DSM 14787]
MGLGVGFVVLAAFFWGLSGGIGGILMADGWDAFVVSFYRGAIGLLFVLAWLAWQPRGSGLASGRLWIWSAVAGLGVAGNFAFYFVSIAHGSVAVAATLMYCAPVFVYLVSFALKLETPTALKLVAIAVVMVGIVLLTQIYDTDAGGVTLIGAGAGLLAGLSYAVFIFGFKYAGSHGSPQAVLSIAFGVLVILLMLPGDNTQMVAALSTPDWPLFAALGVFGAGLSFAFYINGLRHTAPAVASIVAMIEPVTATLFGVALLHESLAFVQTVGMALILVTVTALSVSSRAAPPALVRERDSE